MNLEELIAASQDLIKKSDANMASNTLALDPHTQKLRQRRELMTGATQDDLHIGMRLRDRSISNNASSPALVLANGHVNGHANSHANETTNETTNAKPSRDATTLNGVGTTMPSRTQSGKAARGATRNERDKASRNRPDNDTTAGQTTDILPDPTTEAISSSTYGLPIIVAIIPPMGALVYGKSDVWSDFLLLLLIAFYLYNIIKVPWEIYYAARSRRVINEKKLDSIPEAGREQATKELRRHEQYALLLVVASPIIGGYALHYAKSSLMDYDKYLTHFNIFLFVFAAGIRPLMHIAMLAKNRTLYLQELVHYPTTEVELLKKRLQHLEYEFSQLRQAVATKREISNLRNGFEPTLTQLNKAVRRYERKEQYLRNYSEERFTYLEAKLQDYDTFIAYKLQEEQAMSLPRSALQVMFLPLNVTLTLLSYARRILPKSLRGHSMPLLQPAGSISDDEEPRTNDDAQLDTLGKELQKY